MKADPKVNKLLLNLLETLQHEGVVAQGHVPVGGRDAHGHMQRDASLQGFCLAVQQCPVVLSDNKGSFIISDTATTFHYYLVFCFS